MPVNVDRIRADVEAIARITKTPGNGATRPTFSGAWGLAREYVLDQAKAAGCSTWTDASGNVHARPAALDAAAPAYLCGSHIDTVPHGGDYDGVAGVVVAMELLRSANEDHVTLPLELVVFAEEEGPTFGLGMLGSRAWVGELSAEQLASLRNAAGENYLEAGKPFGVDGGRLIAERLEPKRYLGLIEVHIEQGPGMWRREQPLAVVRAIAGRRQYQVTVLGEANHAGATAMADRRDALTCAAEIVAGLERLAPSLSADAVMTVGRLVNAPNAVNVIPDRVEFTIDFRSADDATLARGDGEVRCLITGVAARRSMRVTVEQTESIPARPMDARLIERLRTAATADLPVTVSGALHDSAVLAPYVPTVMLFVPSRDGVSHNPAEFSRVEDVAAAAQLVERVVRRPAVRQLNAMDGAAFVSVCGRFFENSPWIAERTWERGRPFASRADLHEKMCATLAKASDAEKLTLIRAHPDLVGRLARENKLTRESTREQAAAGLDALSESEVAAFETYNAQYRERFGFPFVICARESRKEAILAAFPVRLKNTAQQEMAAAVAEIEKIARLRLMDATWDD